VCVCVCIHRYRFRYRFRYITLKVDGLGEAGVLAIADVIYIYRWIERLIKIQVYVYVVCMYVCACIYRSANPKVPCAPK